MRNEENSDHLLSLPFKLHFQEIHYSKIPIRLSNLKEKKKLSITSLQNVYLESLIYDNRSPQLMHYEAYSFLWTILKHTTLQRYHYGHNPQESNGVLRY